VVSLQFNSLEKLLNRSASRNLVTTKNRLYEGSCPQASTASPRSGYINIARNVPCFCTQAQYILGKCARLEPMYRVYSEICHAWNVSTVRVLLLLELQKSVRKGAAHEMPYLAARFRSCCWCAVYWCVCRASKCHVCRCWLEYSMHYANNGLCTLATWMDAVMWRLLAR
jgi:hypothetical protein